MLDFSRLEQYRENNRIEAKTALGGLPKSIWETYSAFANTLGGVILLGVIETADKTFDSVNLPDPDRLIRELWRIINDPVKVSVNILTEKDVYVEEINGDHIIVIKVPRAGRADKPVYIDNDIRNTYRRSGEGDYRCTYEEYQAMVRDAAIQSPDMRLMRGMSLETLNSESIRSFRVPLDTVKSGGVSDPRNTAMARMFRPVDVGEYTGGGIPNLYRVWKAEGWPEPVFTASCSPARVSLTLYMTNRNSDEETTAGGKQVPLGALSRHQLLIDHLTDHPTSDLFALSKVLGVSLSRTESLLQ